MPKNATWGISMKFSGKMWLMIILKATINTGLHPLSERCFFGKKHRGMCVFVWVDEGGGGVKTTLPSLFRVKESDYFLHSAIK